MKNTPSDFAVFDRDRIRFNRLRATRNFERHDFLFEWSKNVLSDRLSDINRQFELGAQLGSRGAFSDMEHPKIDQLFTMDLTPQPVQPTTPPYFVGDEEFLPLKRSALDLILSNLCLHSVNDLPGALLQIRQALKADGLFLACMFGGETLYELRDVMMRAESNIYGGVSPRVFPFADKPQMGDLLQRAGFALPVVDSEIITVTYDHVFKLFHDLRGMGETNAILKRDKRLLSRDFFMEAAKLYQEMYTSDDGRITASFEIIFLLGWSPHESQQKPLRPGSAKTRLADALGTTEIKTGEKANPDD